MIHEDKTLRIIVEDDGTITMRFDPQELNVIDGLLGEAINEDDDPEIADLQWRFSEANRYASYDPNDPNWDNER